MGYVISLWYLLLLDPPIPYALVYSLQTHLMHVCCWVQCLQAATSLVKLMAEDCVSSGFVPYFPELLYVLSVFAAIVLLKVSIASVPPESHFYSLLIDSFLILYRLGTVILCPSLGPLLIPTVPASGVQRLSGYSAGGEHHQARPTPPHRLDLGLPPLLARRISQHAIVRQVPQAARRTSRRPPGHEEAC